MRLKKHDSIQFREPPPEGENGGPPPDLQKAPKIFDGRPEILKERIDINIIFKCETIVKPAKQLDERRTESRRY
jgi:hypothetical protein